MCSGSGVKAQGRPELHRLQAGPRSGGGSARRDVQASSMWRTPSKTWPLRQAPCPPQRGRPGGSDPHERIVLPRQRRRRRARNAPGPPAGPGAKRTSGRRVRVSLVRPTCARPGSATEVPAVRGWKELSAQVTTRWDLNRLLARLECHGTAEYAQRSTMRVPSDRSGRPGRLSDTPTRTADSQGRGCDRCMRIRVGPQAVRPEARGCQRTRP